MYTGYRREGRTRRDVFASGSSRTRGKNNSSLLNSTQIQISQEEAGIKADLKHIGVLLFVVDGAEQTWHIDMYHAEGYQGTITE